jgi:hypothetical protein
MAPEERNNARRGKRKRILKDPSKPVRYEAVKWGISKEQINLTFSNLSHGNTGFK